MQFMDGTRSSILDEPTDITVSEYSSVANFHSSSLKQNIALSSLQFEAMAEFTCKPEYLEELTDDTNVTSSANNGLAYMQNLKRLFLL